MAIKLICFDLNKTLISENTWLELNQAMGMSLVEDQELFDLYQARKLTYTSWQKELERIYIARGKATKENILKVVFNYTYNPGAKEIIKYLKDKGYFISLISGSIDLLVEKVANELGITNYSANNAFVFDKNNYLSAINCLGDDGEVKVFQLKEQCRKLGIKVNETACVGDGDNDLGIFKLSGHGVTFKGSKIESKAWKVINKLPDLRLVL